MTNKEMYFSFSGRMSRQQYWIGALKMAAFGIMALLALMLLGVSDAVIVSVYWLIILMSVVPGLALQVKRLHDRGKSGWFLLINFIPFAGIWYFIDVALLAGEEGKNQYGPDPRASEG